ncbi:MAG: rod shape-determining protein MreC [Alphaproteobacteria bacterium]
MARSRAGSLLRFTMPVRSLAHRFPFLLLVLAILILIVIGRIETVFVERLRTNVADVATPIIEFVASPIVAAQALLEEVSDLILLRQENQRLRAEVAALQQSNQALGRLVSENNSLRALTNFVGDAEISHVTARTITDSGSAFVRSVLVNAGERDGVKKGDPVINDEGVVGRIIQSGQRSSRVILITDWNSRIPVLVEASGEKAILAGDNTDRPRLLYLSEGAVATPGERIITSGDGGVFPPGLPIGTVSFVGEEGIRVQPFVTWSRLGLVRIVNYGLEGVLPSSPTGPDAKEDARR